MIFLQTMFLHTDDILADDVPRCSCRRCDSAESLPRNLKDARLSSTRPGVSSSAKPKATQMGPTRMGTTRPETTQGSPPREFVSAGPGVEAAIWRLSSEFLGLLVSPGDSPQSFSDYSSRQGTLLRVSRTTRLARGLSSEFLGLLVSPGVLRVSRTTRLARGLSSEFLGLLVSPGDSPQSFSDYSSRQGTLLRVSRTTRLARGLSSEFLGLLVSPGDSPQSFSDYSSRQGTLLRVSRTTRLARGLSSEFLGLLVSPGDSPQSFSDYSSRQGTLLRVSRTTRLARGLSSEFLGLLVSPGDSPQSFSDYSSRQGTLLRVSRTTRLARGLSSEFLGLLVSPGESYPHPGRVAKGVILLPSRGLGSRTIRRPMRLRRLHIANTGTISRVTRNIFVMLLWLFAELHHKKVSSRLQYSAQPSPKRLLVFEAASIIDESSTTYSICHGHRIISSIGRTYCRLPPLRLLSRRQGRSSI